MQGADIVCVQELKAQPGDITGEVFSPDGYHGYFHCAEKKGYSGVGIYTRKLKLTVFVEFGNKGEGLGIPLPAGVVRTYKKDSRGNIQFVGEDQIDHTPADEIVRLKLGTVFDVTAEKKQTDFKRLAGEGQHSRQTSS